MDKSCANHPESMALATCKACEKSVCLMCVVDEKEGTFCSSDCHSAFASGRQVPKFAGAATNTGGSSSGLEKIESIFDDEPSAPSAPQTEIAPPPEDSMPIVAEGTKWRPIGSQCEAHQDTPAVANCDRCGKPVCALCLLEAAQGTFCSAQCMGTAAQQPAAQAAPAERAALQGKPVFKFKEPPKSNKGLMVAAIVVLLGAGAVGIYYGWNVIGIDLAPSHGQAAVVPVPVAPPPPMASPVGASETVKTDPVPEVKTPETRAPEPPKTAPDPAPPPYVYVRPRPVPKPVIVPTRTLNPWADYQPGSWYRLKTVQGGKVILTDTGLKEKGQDYYVQVTQTFADGQASPIVETKVPFPTLYLRGEESFTFDGQPYLCEIRTPGLEESAPKTWALLSGRNMGAVLKADTPAGVYTTRVIWEGNWRVDGRTLDCLVVEGQIQQGATTRAVKSWYSNVIPQGLVRQEMGEDSLALIHLGADWSKRPAFGQ